MRRYGNPWQSLVSFENLLAAAKKACRGKRFRPSVAQFHFNLEHELWALHEELANGCYHPGEYQTFFVYEPKKRLISAAPYRDRIVHHALTRILEPIFEKSFVHDSYACRIGKGTHAAVRRCSHYARQFRYVLKADIRKFFPSMDHALLKDLIARKIKDPLVLRLAGLLIDHSNPQETVTAWFPGDDLWTPSERRRGIPIGNQTSQFFANVYLDPLDHFIKERLRTPGYARYVDDFLLFADDKARLGEAREQIRGFLAGFRLKLHATKTVVFPTTQGIRFLGYRVFPTHRLLAKENVHRFRRRVRAMQQDYALGRLSLTEVRQRLASWIGHACHANTHRLRTMLFAKMVF